MRKLVFVVVGLFALFTFIKAYSTVRAEGDKAHQELPPTSQSALPGQPLASPAAGSGR